MLKPYESIYRVVDGHIEVIAFWDTRREPTKQAQQTIESLNLES